jgi:hypothetical protein
VRRPFALLFTSLLVLSLGSCGFLGIGDVTIAWDEDVVLQSGQMLTVQRELTIGPNGWGRAGAGRLQEQSIVLTTDGKSVKWQNHDKWRFSYLPEVLEIIDGMPVIVMPVHEWGPCLSYDFPQEGLVAFGFRDGHWQRIPLRTIPRGVKVNLLRSAHALQYWPEYKNRRARIEAGAKAGLESQMWAPKQGASLDEAARFYADAENSCARMRPLPDPQLEQSRQRNTDAERNAPTIEATAVSVASQPEAISEQAYMQQRGWGYLAPSCRGIVEKIEEVRRWSGDRNGYRSQFAGYQLIMANASKRKIPVDSALMLERVVCDPTAIYVVRRQNKEQLILHRFRRDGEPIDAFRVFLPETSKIVAGPDWGTTWSVAPDAQGNLALSIADYTYPGLPNRGGTIKGKVSYLVQLPSPSQQQSR